MYLILHLPLPHLHTYVTPSELHQQVWNPALTCKETWVDILLQNADNMFLSFQIRPTPQFLCDKITRTKAVGEETFQTHWNFNDSYWLDCNPLYIIYIYIYMLLYRNQLFPISTVFRYGGKKSIHVRGKILMCYDLDFLFCL